MLTQPRTALSFKVYCFGGSNNLNVNTVSAKERACLPSVGPVTAGRIVAYRSEHGAFVSLDELRRVKGIDPRTIRQARGACHGRRTSGSLSPFAADGKQCDHVSIETQECYWSALRR